MTLITYYRRKDWIKDKIKGSWYGGIDFDVDCFYFRIFGVETSITWKQPKFLRKK